MLFLLLGIAVVVLGAAALGAAVTVTLASVLLFGGLLVAGGIIEIVRAFRARKSGGFLMHLLSGLLYGMVGLLMLFNPAASALTLALLLAVLFIVGGIFRITAASAIQYRGWVWTLVSGIVSVALGVIIWALWPASGLLIIGTLIGIDLIVYGWSTIMLSLAARRLGTETARPGETGRQAA